MRGAARAFLIILGFLGGVVSGLLAILFLDQKFHGFWTPALFAMAVAFLLGHLPGLRSSLRWAYATLIFGAASTGWMLSRPLMHKDLMDAWYRGGPKATGAIAALAALWFAVAYWRQAKRPSLVLALLMVLFAGIVGYFSSSIGGKPGTVHLLQILLHLDPQTADEAAIVLRKCLHFTFYGLIGLTAWNLARSAGTTGRKTLTLGLSLALCYACLDEIRQSDAATRGSSIVDVALDMAGATTFCLIAERRQRRVRRAAKLPPVQPTEEPLDQEAPDT